MQKDNDKIENKKRIFIVEHMEEYLYEWCLHEYLQMKKYLQNTNVMLYITNFKVVFSYEGSKKDENDKYVKILEQEFAKKQNQFLLIRESVVELVQLQKLDQPVCMLDMRGEKQLSVGQSWSILVFGGILGDHPPRDRPAPVRKHFHQIRHLGDLQLATDTAVGVSKLILCNGVNLKQIPMIREPTIKGWNKQGQPTRVQMEGFSYISKELDMQTGKLMPQLSKKQKKSVYMSEGVAKLLIEEDLAADLLM